MGILFVKDLPALLFVCFTVFILREIVTYREIIPLKYLLTPLVTALSLVICMMAAANQGLDSYSALIFSALTVSLIADVLLMIVEVDLLKYGIVFFLGAHVLYIAAFGDGYAFSPWHLGVLLVLGAGIYVFNGRLGHLEGAMRLPLFVYMIILCSMAFFTVTAAPARVTFARQAMVVAGAFLFIVSDITLAVNAFIRKIPHSSVLTWLTYGPAQLLFALSCFR